MHLSCFMGLMKLSVDEVDEVFNQHRERWGELPEVQQQRWAVKAREQALENRRVLEKEILDKQILVAERIVKTEA